MIDYENFSNLYNEWWQNRTPEECGLQLHALEYEEEYFEDMLLEKNSILYDVSETLLEYTDDVFMGIGNVVRFYIINSNDFYGCFYCNEYKIEIDRDHVTKKVILHELIHYYEYQLEMHFPFIRELLILELYNKLLPLIADLRERIFKHCEMYSHLDTFYGNGAHGVLFFLKSLDLDIRCGYPLGTVCGYGRDN